VFDHLLWWQAIAILLPLLGMMHWIRYREDTVGATPFRDLAPSQKTWLLLQLLPPSVGAKFLYDCSEEQRKQYLLQGQKISGSAIRLQDAVVYEYLKESGLPLKDAEASTPRERLARAALSNPEQAIIHLREVWPVN
jgi:hypothetical protein